MKKIAFIKIGGFSHINDNVLRQLNINFPDYQVDVIDVYSDLVSKKIAAAYSLAEYTKGIILGRMKIKESYMYTRYAFRIIKKKMQEISGNSKFLFTFQTQSLFDASAPGIPHFVYTDHTHLYNLKYPGFDMNRFRGPHWVDLEKNIYRNAAMNFTMSSNISRSLIEDYSCSPEKVRCVYCGSNIQVDSEEKTDDRKYARKNILFIGLEWERKGGPVVEEAFKKVLEVLPEATLTIVGCSPRLDLKNCTVTGKVPLQDEKNYFRNASVFCMPSNIEPFGIVFLEAMAFRLPVIGTNIGAMPDFIHNGRNGYLISPGDPDSLANHLIDLLKNPGKCKEFGDNGHDMFLERYSWETTGTIISESIKSILSQNCA